MVQPADDVGAVSRGRLLGNIEDLLFGSQSDFLELVNNPIGGVRVLLEVLGELASS